MQPPSTDHPDCHIHTYTSCAHQIHFNKSIHLTKWIAFGRKMHRLSIWTHVENKTQTIFFYSIRILTRVLVLSFAFICSQSQIVNSIYLYFIQRVTFPLDDKKYTYSQVLARCQHRNTDLRKSLSETIAPLDSARWHRVRYNRTMCVWMRY